MSLPFGIKKPSRGTVIFTGIIGTLGGSYYASKYYAQQSRQALCDKVSWLANRPCGVHERPRKVQIFITAPPGDGLEKSRNWFGEYIKPVLVAAAIDYEVKEAREPGQIEKLVREQVINLRKNEQQQSTETNVSPTTQNPFTPVMQDIVKQQRTSENEFDGMIAIGRNAWRELLTGLDKGCTVSLQQVAREEALALEQKTKDEQNKTTKEDESSNTSSLDETSASYEQSEVIMSDSNQQENVVGDNNKQPEFMSNTNQQENINDDNKDDNLMRMDDNVVTNEKDRFNVPASLSPVIYIPHENIIGWTNIPYRIYMWLADYQRIERFGEYAVSLALNKTKPLAIEDIDVGYQEMKYWVGDDEAKSARNDDQPIQIEDRVREELKTYTN
ncbi:mitochondrial import inner membrane translocase subunit Tim54 [Halteromyces radiatus]|uniref:mitochondrial import inner membrane translocase subunit Tim54 n=1 Tax=Halteromyces radiatus TaxID=101107 RepID=UPI00221E6D09|nr:mitochondrial import inner membrane translocase subunit Tim54 [Halteromyces radiatus]KAI8092516.1 mitochondrial import inner membrane translocase subunit Tim54 [Halteromyces radiatus]